MLDVSKRTAQSPAIFVEDSFDGKTIAEGMQMAGEKFGYKFALVLSMVMGGKDFSSQVLKAKAANVDAIFCNDNCTSRGWALGRSTLGVPHQRF